MRIMFSLQLSYGGLARCTVGSRIDRKASWHLGHGADRTEK